MIIRMTRAEAEEIIANTNIHIMRHPGQAHVDIDGNLTLKELMALAWLIQHCPDWKIGV